jgi:hypothetical protein
MTIINIKEYKLPIIAKINQKNSSKKYQITHHHHVTLSFRKNPPPIPP